MRKYDSKNKRNIGIIVGIGIIFAIIFSYFLIQEIKLSKIKYELDSATLVFDVDKNTILLNEIGTIKKKWNDKYYLTYKEQQYQIGTHVIAFNNSEVSLSLYGEFYEVNKKSEINITKEETKLNNLGISRFYKIADRKYLIVDPVIRADNSTLETSHYLIVELDKLGNAILYNNNLNVKTFSETKIVTSTYTFDIANELLIYDDTTVDLKKILGTTNEYKKPEEDKDGSGGGGGAGGSGDGTGDGTGSGGSGGGSGGSGGGASGSGSGTGDGSGSGGSGGGSGGSGGAGGSGSGTGDGSGSGDGIITEGDGSNISGSEIINQTASTSIIKINPSVNSVSVDYVIYDTIGKYLSTFVEIRNSSDGKLVSTVHLTKSSTNVTIPNLAPGTKYKLIFKYTYMDNDNPQEEVIDEQYVTTLLPTITLKGTKITNKYISYEIKVDSYQITDAKLRIYIDGEKQDSEKTITSANLSGDFDISNISLSSDSEEPPLIRLSLEDIYINGTKINKTVSWYYKKEQTGNSNVPVIPTPETPTPGEDEGEENEE